MTTTTATLDPVLRALCGGPAERAVGPAGRRLLEEIDHDRVLGAAARTPVTFPTATPVPGVLALLFETAAESVREYPGLTPAARRARIRLLADALDPLARVFRPGPEGGRP